MAVLLLGVVCSRSTHAAVFDPAKSYRTIKTPHFAIHYAGELEAVARRAAGLVEEVHGVLTPQYRWKPRGRTQVVLMDNNDDANGAAAVVPYNWLLLRVTAPEAGNALATYDDWLRTLIMHEYTHILHMDQTGGIMALPRFLLGKIVAPNGLQPAWMREGLAVHEETQESTGGRGRASFSEMMLRTAALHDRLLKITQADGFGWRWPAANAQYIYGGKFVEWLAAKYGEEKLLRYHRRVGRSPLLFMVNHQAKRIWKKSLSTLWREWQQELKDKYAAERAAIEGKGLTALQPLSQAAPGLSAPVVSRDGAQLAYTAVDYHRHPEIRVRDLATGADRVVRKKQVATQLSFSPDGEQLAYSAAGAHKNFSFVQDIYLLHLKTQKLSRLTAGRRAFDPDFSPDGKQLVYVVNNAGTQQLMVYDLATRSETALPIPAEVTTQYANPRWAPDGKSIAVSSWRLGGYRDILVVRPSGTVLKELTHDRALDNSPAWSRDGRRIYFMSDRSGVPNIYRYDLATGRLHQVTNVLTGVFEPTITPDEKTLVVQHYTGAGYDLRKVDLTTVRGSMFEVRTPDPESRTADPESRTADPISKKYSPFTPSLLVPRFLSPNVLALDNGVLLSAVTGGADPLRWHNWIAGASYRTDAKHVGYFGSYYYNRYMPVFDLGVLNYAVNFGNLTFLHQDGTLRTVHLYEKRLRGSAGLSVPWKQHRFSLQYFMENRDNIPMLTAEERAAL
ncbi:MAG: PD40 domain-containing protein, partial [Deltaproteobacteria bacterium]|nr:PD40 domain-containing protein [Deltaproteobacteria bacterium]